MRTTLYCTVVFIFYFTQVLARDIPEPFLDEIALKCIKETNFDSSKLPAIANEDFLIKNADPDMHKLMECTFKGHKILKDDGEIDMEKLSKEVKKKMISVFTKDVKDFPEICEKAIEKCKNFEGDSWPKRMVNFHNCIVKEINGV